MKFTAVNIYLPFPYIKAYNPMGGAQGKMKMQVPGWRQGSQSPQARYLNSWWTDDPPKTVISAPN